MRFKFIAAIFLIGIQTMGVSKVLADSSRRFPDQLLLVDLKTMHYEEVAELNIKPMLPSGQNDAVIGLRASITDMNGDLPLCSNPYVTCLKGKLDFEIRQPGFTNLRFYLRRDPANDLRQIMWATVNGAAPVEVGVLHTYEENRVAFQNEIKISYIRGDITTPCCPCTGEIEIQDILIARDGRTVYAKPLIQLALDSLDFNTPVSLEDCQ